MKKLFIFILLSIFLLACNDGRQKYTILFNRVDNINKGSEVKIKGIVVGRVSRMKLLNDSVAVTVSMNKGAIVSSGTTATIIASPIGSPYIALEQTAMGNVLTGIDTLRNGTYKERKLLDEFMSDSVKRERVINAFDTIKSVLDQLMKSRDSIGN